MKKINIGMVLIILSIISFVIVVILDAKNQKEEVEKAREFASEFLEVMEKYILLPEEYRDINKVMGKEEYEKYILEMREEVGKYILDDVKENLLGEYEGVLKQQYEGNFIIKDYDVELEFTENLGVFTETGSRYKVGDVIKIYFNEKMKSIIDKRTASIKHTDTGRYMGEVYEQEDEYTLPRIMILKKLDNGEYKVVWYFKVF